MKRHVTFPQGREGRGAPPYSQLSFSYLLPKAPISFRGRRERAAQTANCGRR